MAGKIRGNGLAIGMKADELRETLELADTEHLAEKVVEKLKGLERMIEAVLEDSQRSKQESERSEEVDICDSCKKFEECELPMRLALASVTIRECSSYIKGGEKNSGRKE